MVKKLAMKLVVNFFFTSFSNLLINKCHGSSRLLLCLG